MFKNHLRLLVALCAAAVSLNNAQAHVEEAVISAACNHGLIRLSDHFVSDSSASDFRNNCPSSNPGMFPAPEYPGEEKLDYRATKWIQSYWVDNQWANQMYFTRQYDEFGNNTIDTIGNNVYYMTYQETADGDFVRVSEKAYIIIDGVGIPSYTVFYSYTPQSGTTPVSCEWTFYTNGENPEIVSSYAILRKIDIKGDDVYEINVYDPENKNWYLDQTLEVCFKNNQAVSMTLTDKVSDTPIFQLDDIVWERTNGNFEQVCNEFNPSDFLTGKNRILSATLTNHNQCPVTVGFEASYPDQRGSYTYQEILDGKTIAEGIHTRTYGTYSYDQSDWSNVYDYNDSNATLIPKGVKRSEYSVMTDPFGYKTHELNKKTFNDVVESFQEYRSTITYNTTDGCPETMTTETRTSESEGFTNYRKSEFIEFTKIPHLHINAVQEINAEDQEDGETEYYTLSGIRLDHPVKGDVMIVRKNGKTSKVLLR